MTAPHRIQRRRAKGWTMPDNTVYVGRGSPWGNPFVVGRDGTRARCVELYELMLAGYYCLTLTPSVKAQMAVTDHVVANLAELRGKNLACWCRDDGKPCHADVLLKIANK